MKGKEKKTNKKQVLILLLILLALCVSGVGIFLLTGRKRTDVVMTGEGSSWNVEWYDENEDEFILTTKDELMGLAELSQDNDFLGKTIKLGADIVFNEGNAKDWTEESPETEWKPIGRDDVPFNGTFDGQGHTISGLYCNNSDEMTGFFAATDDKSEISNFSIVNSYFKLRGEQGIGGVAARGAGLFSRIYCDAIIECEGTHAGGIMGYKKNKGSAIISECWFDGYITTTDRFAGGIAGRVYRGGCTIQHCLNTGDVYSTYANATKAATIGGITGNASERLVITDCFNSGLIVSEANRPEVASIIGSVSAAGNVTSGLNWATREGAPATVGSVNSDATVTGSFFQLPEKLLTGYEAYKRTDLNFEKYWAVVEDSTPILQCFAESIPSVEGIERAMTADTSWYDVTKVENVITTAEQLKGFAVLSANGEKFYGKIIKLGADITYNAGNAKKYDKEPPLNMWIPVNKFMGTFDGQGHTISGLYVGGATDHVGMFSFTENKSVVKNLKLKNSYFESTTTNSAYGCGSVAGAGGGTFERIYSDAIVVTSAGYCGGIIGIMNRDGNISECWFDGEVAAAGRRSGGIAGGSNAYYVSGNLVKTSSKISHCLNTGYIHRTDKKATDSATSGGIVGVSNSNNTLVIDDCFSAGKVTSPKYESGKNDELGAIVSAIASDGNCTIKNSWGTVQSYKKVLTTIKSTAVSKITMSQVLAEELIQGYGAVRLTTLNFDKYWSVDLEGTPVLKYFTKNAPSLTGVIKPDVSWYKENKTEFVVTNVEQLYGLSILANTGVTFEGKTVKLGNDITVNSGDASTWKTSAPKNNWFPIKDFAGTFDGQGHTISGIYSVDTEKENIGRGLFTKTVKSALIQNVKVTNSYFETKTLYAVGAIASRGCGTFKNIYSDAIINNVGGGYTGGIVGRQLWDDIIIENCWFAGDITDTGRRIGGILGYSESKNATVSHCLFTGSISRVGDTVNNNMALAGGIVGCVKGTMTISDCFSVGTFSSERTKSKDTMGALVGETVKSSNITLKNLYGSESSWSKAIGSNGSKANVSTCMVMPENLLKGENASLLTQLDFANYWAVIQDGTPQLKAFATGNVISNPKVADVSWYTNGTYKLENMEDLYGLRLLSVTDTFAGKTITLTKDIDVNAGKSGTESAGWNTSVPAYLWLPIQNFAGTIEGNGFAISGLYGKAASNNTYGMALFGKTKANTVVQNLSVMNSYFETTSLHGLSAISSGGAGTFKNITTNAYLVCDLTSSVKIGGILGQATGTTTIEGCQSTVSVTSQGQRIGGIVGYTNDQKVTVAHCLFDGSITRTVAEDADTKSNTIKQAYAGGLVGSAKGTVKISDSFVNGTITSELQSQGSMGAVAGETAKNSEITIETVYIEDSCTLKAVSYNGAGADVSTCIAIPEYAILGENASLTMFLDFKGGSWAAIEGSTPEPKAVATGKVIDNPETMDIAWYESGKYELEDMNDLYGVLALSYVNENFDGKVLTLLKDIEVNGAKKDGTEAQGWKAAAPTYNWIPIKNFAGEFDGDGFAISGLYGMESEASKAGIALFSETKSTAKIHDVSLMNSLFKSNNVNGMAGIASRGQGEFKNIHTNVILYNENAGKIYMGGIVGVATGELTIDNCWSEADISGAGRYAGGILGSSNDKKVTIEHCLNSGTVYRFGAGCNSNFADYGGIIGSATKGDVVTINDCLNVGTVKSDRTANWNDVAHIAGEGPGEGYKDKLIITNCYGVQGNCYNNRNNAQTILNVLVGANASHITASDNGVLAAEKLQGTAAFDNTTLDFKTEGNYWVLKGDGTNAYSDMYPVLRVFNPNEKDYLYGQIQYDTTWYDATSKKGTITDKWDLFGLTKIAALATDKDIVITLGNDIVVNALASGTDVSTWKQTAPEYTWTYIEKFAGTLNGNGFGIYGLYNNSPTADNIAFIKATTTDAKIQNVTFDNCCFIGKNNLAVVAGKGAGTFDKVHIGTNAKLYSTGQRIGGFLGNAENTLTISNSWFEGYIEATNPDPSQEANKDCARNVGGFVGQLNTASKTYTIEHSLSAGTVKRINGKNANGGIGGFVGKANNGTLVIDDCLHHGVVASMKNNVAFTDEVGLIIGNAGANATKDYTNTYSDKREASTSTNIIGGTRTTDVDGNDLNDSALGYAVNSSDVKGTSINTSKIALNFTTKWMMRENDYPALRCFQSLKADVTWFDRTTNKGTITSPEDLYGFATLAKSNAFNKDSVITLGNNITVNILAEGTDVSTWAVKANAPINEWSPIENFAGEFNGNGKTIYGLYGVSESDACGMGLFANTTEDAYIHNLTIDDCYFAIGTNQGLGAVSSKGGGTFERIHIGKNVLLQDIGFSSADKNADTLGGGILGHATSSKEIKISYCWVECKLQSKNQFVGGIVGELARDKQLTIEHCLSAATIQRDVGGNANGGYGGIIGRTHYYTTLVIDDCLYIGKISSSVDANDEMGLIVGCVLEAGSTKDKLPVCTRTYSIVKEGTTTVNMIGAGTNAKATYNDTDEDKKGWILDVSAITGTNIDTNIVKLDFADTWDMVTNSTPVLKELQ